MHGGLLFEGQPQDSVSQMHYYTIPVMKLMQKSEVLFFRLHHNNDMFHHKVWQGNKGEERQNHGDARKR